MSKKLGKFLTGFAAIGAAAAGAYYVYKKKKTEDDFEDEFNEDFETQDFSLDDDLGEVNSSERGYVPLTPSKKEDEEPEQSVSDETPADEPEQTVSTETPADEAAENVDATEETKEEA